VDKLYQIAAFFAGCLVALSSNAQLSLEDIFLKGMYTAKTPGTPAFFHQSDRHALLKQTPKGQTIVVYDDRGRSADTLKLYAFWTDSNFPQPRYEGLEISHSDAYYLLKANEEKAYRRSGAANYFITDTTGVIGQVGSGKYSFLSFSPDDQKLAGVKYNNLYWFDLEEGLEKPVTTDGKWNAIINGKSDWVYEEELELTRAFEWSPKSDRIAYLKFDETNVKEYQMPLYYGQTYPTFFSYKYPKAGEENSKVSVWVYDLKKNKNVPLRMDDYSFEYIPRIYWNADGTEVWIMLLNRHQDSLQVVAYDIQNKKTRTVYQYHSDTYVNVPFAFDILDDQTFIVNSDRDGFEHLYHIDGHGKLIRQLTSGNFEVTEYYGADEKNKKVFYQSNEDYTAGRQLYSLHYETLHKQNIVSSIGTNTALFSPGFRFFMNNYSSAADPGNTSIITVDQPGTVLLKDNKDLRSRFSPYPQKEFIKVPVPGAELEAWIIKPLPFDPAKKYPLLLYVYGGPGNQEVLDKWGGAGDRWFSYLAQQGYVVACADNRGSGGRGVEFEKILYQNLGKQESADQIAAARYFSTLSYIDSSRIGIYGASYGGYLAALCLLEGNGLFKTAIAQSPVSDWRFYDNIYTERYMRTPAENKYGYEQFNLINDAYKLSGNLLLIHGITDDNVHFQHTVELIRALNEHHKTYDLYIYPDNNHGIRGGETRYDLYSKITQYLFEKL
jgi:dipeptidyl-peptidase-4